MTPFPKININIQMKMQGRKQQPGSELQNQNSSVFQLRSLKKDSRAKSNVKLDFKPLVETYADIGISEFGFTLFQNEQVQATQNEMEPAGSLIAQQQARLGQENKEMFQRFAGKPAQENANQCLITQAKPRSSECRICRETFDDYLQHIKHIGHLKKEAEHRIKTSRMFDSLLGDLTFLTKRPRSQKILPSQDIEDEQFSKGRPSCKMIVIFDQCPVRVDKKKSDETCIGSTTSIPAKSSCTPISIPSLPLLQ